MPIRDLQRRMQEVGRIRLGPSMAGRRYPDRLSTFRFTSPYRHLIEEIASLYGGEVTPWNNQLEVVTEANEVPVYTPPQTLDPYYEQWGNGVCTRRCDGYHDIIHDQQCDCDPDERTCKPVIRLNVMLADIQGLGVWRLESHGMNAVSELSMLTVVLSRVSMPLPARLVLRTETRKFFNREEGKVEKREFPVPGLLFDQVTARQVQIGGDALTQAIQSNVTDAIEGRTSGEPQAITAEEAPAPATPTGVDPETVKRHIDNATTPEQIRTIWRDAAAGGWLTDGLKTLLTAKAEQLTEQIRRQQATKDAQRKTRQENQPVTGQADPFKVTEDPSRQADLWADALPPTTREASRLPGTQTIDAPVLSSSAQTTMQTRDPWDSPPVDPVDEGAQPDPWPAGPGAVASWPTTVEPPPEDPDEPEAAAPEQPTPEVGSGTADAPAAQPAVQPDPPAVAPDKGATWMALMQQAGARKWDSAQLSQFLLETIGVEGPATATAEQLQTALEKIRGV